MDLDRAVQLIQLVIPPTSAVGVFVDRSPEEILTLCRTLGLEIVQLHGSETVEHIRILKNSNLRVIKAFRVGGAEDLVQLARFQMESSRAGVSPDAILLDARVEGAAGGTGKPIPPELLGLLPPSAGFETELETPRPVRPRIILAGGLNPTNVRKAVERIRPWMVDAASGVESSPGIKDCKLVEAFIKAAKLA